MSKKVVCLALCSLLFALCSSADAQQPKKVPRIGYISSGDAASESARSEAIRVALRERGHIERQNIAIEYRYAEGKPNRASELAAELVRLKVDVIVVAGGEEWVRAARNATKSIPIVMAGTGADPFKNGPVEKLAPPRGALPGTTKPNTTQSGKRREAVQKDTPPEAPIGGLLPPRA